MRLQDVSIKSLGAGFLGAGMLALLLGAPAVTAAQDDREAKPPQQEEPKQEAQPKDAKPEQAPLKNDAKPENNKPQPEEKQNEQMKTQEARPQGNAKPAHAASAAQGRRIPDDKFRASFGRQHTFKVQKTVIVEGQPRFQYSGYSFTLVDPWPVGWAYTDDCYVDYIDGEYVLIDLLHPGVQIALIVVG